MVRTPSETSESEKSELAFSITRPNFPPTRNHDPIANPQSPQGVTNGHRLVLNILYIIYFYSVSRIEE